MKYTKLGNSELTVSRICMGCMGFGDPNNGQHTWTVDEAHTREIVKGGLEPVSYTHLDVYKRQEGGRRNIKLL